MLGLTLGALGSRDPALGTRHSALDARRSALGTHPTRLGWVALGRIRSRGHEYLTHTGPEARPQDWLVPVKAGQHHEHGGNATRSRRSGFGTRHCFCVCPISSEQVIQWTSLSRLAETRPITRDSTTRKPATKSLLDNPIVLMMLLMMQMLLLLVLLRATTMRRQANRPRLLVMLLVSLRRCRRRRRRCRNRPSSPSSHRCSISSNLRNLAPSV